MDIITWSHPAAYACLLVGLLSPPPNQTWALGANKRHALSSKCPPRLMKTFLGFAQSSSLSSRFCLCILITLLCVLITCCPKVEGASSPSSMKTFPAIAGTFVCFACRPEAGRSETEAGRLCLKLGSCNQISLLSSWLPSLLVFFFFKTFWSPLSCATLPQWRVIKV